MNNNWIVCTGGDELNVKFSLDDREYDFALGPDNTIESHYALELIIDLLSRDGFPE